MESKPIEINKSNENEINESNENEINESNGIKKIQQAKVMRSISAPRNTNSTTSSLNLGFNVLNQKYSAIFEKPNSNHETLYKWLYDSAGDENSGNLQHVWKLLNKDTLVDVFNYRSIVKGYSILHRAVEAKQFTNVRFLVQNNFPTNVLSVDGQTPFQLALQVGAIEIANELLNVVDLLITDDLGNTCLHYAIQYGHLEMVKKLLDMKSDLKDIPNLHGLYPIHHVCVYGYEEMLPLFENQINLVDKDSNTPLIYAARNGYLSLVMMLLEKGANKFICNNKNNCAKDLIGVDMPTTISSTVQRNLSNVLDIDDESKIEKTIPELETLHKVHTDFHKRIETLHQNHVNRLERDFSKLYDLLMLVREKQRDLETRYDLLMQLLKKKT
jgi:ankyrin repeat protein